MLAGSQPLLTLDEIRQANSTDVLTLAVLPMPYGRIESDEPQMHELRPARVFPRRNGRGAGSGNP